MQVKIQDNHLILAFPLNAAGNPGHFQTEASKSGKNQLLATTRGNIKTDFKVNGKPLVVAVNAYIPN